MLWVITCLCNAFNDFIWLKNANSQNHIANKILATITTTMTMNKFKLTCQGHAQMHGRGNFRQRGENCYQAYSPHCFNCGKPGHYLKDCWNEPTDATTQARSKKAAATTATKSQNTASVAVTKTSDMHMGDTLPVSNVNQMPEFSAWVSLNTCTSMILINELSVVHANDGYYWFWGNNTCYPLPVLTHKHSKCFPHTHYTRK